MKYAIVDAVNVEDLKNAKGVESVDIINEHGPADGHPIIRIGVKSYDVLHDLGYDEGEYDKA